jgi:hypothetical protein
MCVVNLVVAFDIQILHRAFNALVHYSHSTHHKLGFGCGLLALVSIQVTDED